MAKEFTILTTGDIARICQVSSRTVQKWIDSGLLKGYIIPGKGKRRARRVPLKELKKFMHEYGMPLELLPDEPVEW